MAHMIGRQEAAQARAAGVRQRSDRPQQRKSPGGLRAAAPAHVRRMEVRASTSASNIVTLDGLASATGPENSYPMWDWYGEYTEVMAPGAFGVTLARDGLDVPLVLSHDQLRRIARTTNGTLTLSETSDGLTILAQVDMNDVDTAYIVPKLEAKLIDEMSFAFRIVRGRWSPDYTEYTIDEVDMHRGDVAIVGYGANPYTSVGVTPREAANQLDLLRARLDLELATR